MYGLSTATIFSTGVPSGVSLISYLAFLICAMSDLIHLLPDSVANQIAAGEVIQRPASVIKELVENAVDAGARNINVSVLDAGRTSIQVIDDGKGMSPTDARLAFERHATSKIQKADDLFALHTMGFRGEALASIAAVAQVELQTRLEGEELGTLLTIAGSRVTGQQMVACPVGANFKVENLFYNVPVRRKFLKTNATELNNILTAFERIVLVYPDIHFTLHSNGTEMMNLRPGSLLQRISDVFGRQYGQSLLAVEADTAMCRISGFVGKPESAKKKGGQDYFFVNGRYMKHPYFHKAVATAYDRLVPEGMQVPYFLYFDINPSDIDVNIHPTKTEIKFENEQAIWQIIVAAVRDAIGKFNDIPSIDFDTVGRPDIPVFDPDRDNIQLPKVSYNPDYNPFASSSSHSGKSGQSGSHGISPAGTASWQALYDGLESSSSGKGDASSADLFEFSEPMAPSALLDEKSPVHYQYKGKYVMTAVKSGLMIIDQHRASIRILFDRYAGLAASSGPSLSAPSGSADSGSAAVPSAPSQRLLFPETVQFSPAEAVVLENILSDLTTLGFDLSNLGGNTYAVNGIPVGLDGINPIGLIQQLVAEASDHGASISPSLNLSISQSLNLSISRAAAIPYGQILSGEEMESLINSLFACSNVNYTPDGKAILCILPQADIEHLLG